MQYPGTNNLNRDVLRVGLIGAGRHGSRYAKHIRKDIHGLTLAAISRRSLSGKGQAKRWGAAYYPDWHELVASPEVDAVIVAATPDLNPAIVRHCVACAKPLLLEKPLAVSADEARAIVDLFRAAKLPLTVAQTLRFNTTVLALRQYLARCGNLHYFHASQRLERTVHDWLDDPAVAGAGVILHTAVHVFDALRYITGREVVRLRATRFCRYNSRCEDLFMAMLEMEGGLVGTVDASKVGPARLGRFEFVGHDGQLQGDQIHNFVEFVQGVEVSSFALDEPASTLIPLLNRWRDFLRGLGDNPVPGEEGAAAVAIAEACLLSSERDAWVTL